MVRFAVAFAFASAVGAARIQVDIAGAARIQVDIAAKEAAAAAAAEAIAEQDSVEADDGRRREEELSRDMTGYDGSTCPEGMNNHVEHEWETRPSERDWISSMVDFSGEYPPYPSKSDIRGWMCSSVPRPYVPRGCAGTAEVQAVCRGCTKPTLAAAASDACRRPFFSFNRGVRDDVSLAQSGDMTDHFGTSRSAEEGTAEAAAEAIAEQDSVEADDMTDQFGTSRRVARPSRGRRRR